MAGYFLEKVAIEGFRGINNANHPLELKFDHQKVNSVFGVNGLGKSSIFEAVSYAIRGRVGRLDKMHRDERPSSYYNNCFHPHRKATIALSFLPDDGSPSVEIKVERDVVGTRTVSSPTGHTNPEDFLKSLDNPFLLLDQATFQNFVADTPLARGRAFSSLLGLSEISEIRQVLRVLSNAGTLRTDLQMAQIDSKVIASESTIRDLSNRIDAAFSEFFKEQIEKGEDYTTSPEAVVESLALVGILAPHCAGKKIPGINFPDLEKSIAAAEDSEQRIKLSQIIEKISALELLSANEVEPTELIELEGMVATLSANIALTEGQDFYAMLGAVKKVITSPDWNTPNTCPACDSKLDRALLPEIESGLNAYNLVDDSKASLSSLWSGSTWPGRLRKLEQALSIPDEERQHSIIQGQVRGTPTSENVDSIKTRLSELEASRIAALTALEAEKAEVSASLPPRLVSLTSRVKAAQNLANLIPQLESATTALAKVNLQKAKREAWQAYIEMATLVFSEAETALSTEMAESLEKQYQDSYNRITNNPEIVPVLERSQGSEDLSLRLKRFHTLTDVPAASLLPESYRNALGIAIYLSAAAQRPTTARFMILDDITSSFDAGHQFSLMELIRNVISHPASAAGPQVILLSHDGLLEKYFDKISGQGLWHHHKLQGIPPTGTLLSHGQTPDRLRLVAEQHLNLGQIAAAEPIVRQYLEFVLLQVIRKVGIPVPVDFAIQDDRKMVGNAVEHIKQAVTLHKAAAQLILSSTQENDFFNVHAVAIVGNWVTHYETGIMGAFNAPTLRAVLATIDNLKACFQYPCSCNGAPQPRFYRSLAAKHCKC